MRKQHLAAGIRQGDLAAVQALTSSGQDFDLRVEPRTLAGTAARCLIAEPRQPSGEPELVSSRYASAPRA